MMADFSIQGFGRVALLLGVGIEGFRRLDQRMQQRTASENESFEHGQDVGFERGWKAHEAQGGAPRPVVVDLDSRRCSCGGKKEREREESPALVPAHRN